MHYLGYDIGSSSVKASIVDEQTGEAIASTFYPPNEMDILSKEKGWAEQEPQDWWENACIATKEVLSKSKVDPASIKCIGIAYQMHGLVLVDKNKAPLRPAIIWCDSRAVDLGRKAFESIGPDRCISRLLNSPGNFTASKLKWVKENEPDIYSRIHKIMLPGDFIAMKLTGRIATTSTGLSEAILWDFIQNEVADFVLDNFKFERDLLPEVVDIMGPQGTLTASAAQECGLREGTPVTYRAGDQPNNAISLGVHQPGEVAATCGTSGVVYGVVDKIVTDEHQRVNSFIHVSHTKELHRIGVLLCINGAGILYRWLRNELSQEGTSYDEMEKLASTVHINSEGLLVLPFGNGAERILKDESPGAHLLNLQFNRHTRAHVIRAALEGIAFSFYYGMVLMKQMGVDLGLIRVGNDNLFQSRIFGSTLSGLSGCTIEVLDTTGATGAAKAAAYGLGDYPDLSTAFDTNKIVRTYRPANSKEYQDGYNAWKRALEKFVA